ncbi:MAG: VWA domain-containing protein [Rhodobacterales bacterium]|nr:VWA domain-containing protein [Rhodobacterales bacterium]NCT11259.1 VWA domain-containing protein [Rhodobacterales bacterium]
MRQLVLTAALSAFFVLTGCDAPETGTAIPTPIDSGARGAADIAGGPVRALPSPVIEAPVVEAPVFEAPVVEASAASAPAAGRGLVRAGVLTAGDIDDRLNLAAFTRYLAQTRAATRLPMGNFSGPVLAQVVGADGRAAARQRVTLRHVGAAEPFYDGWSGVDGMVTVFPAILGAGRAGAVEMRAFAEGAPAPVTATLQTGAPRQVVRVPGAVTQPPAFLDLVFVVDTTGSMGDELDWLTRDLSRIVSAAARGYGGVDIRYGLILYRDQGDDYVVRTYPFTGSAATMRAQLRAQSADGGGDYPEAAADALAAAAALPWRRGRGARLLFHIADAPPHDADAARYLAAAAAALRANVTIHALGASGVETEAEYLMRQAAAQTGGRYLFLTDDSGVGLAHAEPRISCYQVTLLSDLVTRVLRAELSGARVEPAAADVIRSVGSYRGGVCLD